MDYKALILVCSMVYYVEGSMQDLTHYYDDHVIGWPGHKPWVYNFNRGPIKTISNTTLW